MLSRYVKCVKRKIIAIKKPISSFIKVIYTQEQNPDNMKESKYNEKLAPSVDPSCLAILPGDNICSHLLGNFSEICSTSVHECF